MNKEPAIIIGAVAAIINVLVLIFKLDASTTAAINAAITAVAAVFIRSQVYSQSSVDKLSNNG